MFGPGGGVILDHGLYVGASSNDEGPHKLIQAILAVLKFLHRGTLCAPNWHGQAEK